jgi:1-acyl-sn-glycerol-3-phosphate acyltransferase
MNKLLFQVLKLLGWKIHEHQPDGVKKAVICVAPHTSNWDFVIGKIAFGHYGIPSKFLVKKELFFFPLGIWLRYLGALPIDRNKKTNITAQVVEHFNNHDAFFLVLTPEGTRSYQPNWKRGFYNIAQAANVPVYLGFIDYKNKTGGFDSKFELTNDVEADILEIKRRLSKYQGRNPENGIRQEELN